MYRCYYQTDDSKPETRYGNDQEDCWCSEEHKLLWQKENYNDNRQRGLRNLKPKQLQIGLLDIQLRELRRKWKAAEDLFERAEIESRAKIIKQKREQIKTDP